MVCFRKALPGPGVRVWVVILVCLLFVPSFAEAQQSAPGWSILWGTDAGLYSRDQAGRVDILWSGGKVEKIIPLNQSSETGNTQETGWALLTDQGIWVSLNLRDWEERNQGLPEKIIKIYENGEKSFVSEIQEIKAFAVDPQNPKTMVCAFKDAVYLSRNGGENWENLGMPSFRSNGIKAAAITSLFGGNLTVICSHNIYGIYYINPDKPGSKWIEMNTGLEKLQTTGNPDEISDIIVNVDPAKSGAPQIYAAQTFRRRIYKLNSEQKTWEQIWSDGSEFGTVDSLSAGSTSLRFVRDGGIMDLDLLSLKKKVNEDSPPDTGPDEAIRRQDLEETIRSIPGNNKPNCVVVRSLHVVRFPAAQESPRQETERICLSELWLLDEGTPEKAEEDSAAEAAGKEGLYLPVNHALDEKSLKPYLDIIEKAKLNMVVIDMKDDHGRLRFTPQNPSIANMGRVFRPVDIDAFLKTMKDRGIYTVARVVVFKDPVAARKDNGKYAVWDGKNDAPWEGYYDTRRKKSPPGQTPEPKSTLITAILPADEPDYEILRTWYDEKWVDPYSEEIWDYNASVAEELHRRGFDEIQFDYIRFPTDGVNLGDARFRWKDAGMDMDSAIISFLRYVRSKVAAPISVDIYGANGWYRTGARTGQEVELLAPWVNVICPMYYPSHFEQDFLAQVPAEQRPYRIYYYGTRRTRLIARDGVIVRPWAQAFYLNVSYDRKYYNSDYVRLQADGVRAAGSGGLTWWNNSGRYDDIPIPVETVKR